MSERLGRLKDSKTEIARSIAALALISVCLCAALVVNAVFYLEALDLRMRVDSLNDEVDSLNNQLAAFEKTWTFKFEWMPYDPIQAPNNQKIVNGTLRMELNFTLDSENLSIVVKVNDDEYNDSDWLCLAFDRNGDGKLGGWEDQPVFMLYACNFSRRAVLLEQDGSFSFSFEPIPSPYHNCTFSETGHVFTTSTLKPPNDAVHVGYGDSSALDYIFTRFHFGLIEEN